MKTMCNRRMSVRSGVVLVSVCVVGLLGGHAQAVDYIFDPLGAGSADWWVNGNWTPAGFPNSVNDLAIFDASANPSYSTNTHPSSPYTVREMRFDTTSNWRIHNNERDINLDAPSGNALITQNGSGTVTYDSDWILIDNTTLGGTGSGEVILNGSILSSPTQRRGIFGAGSLTKEGSFTATINAIIQHTGGTTINDGVFRLNQGVGFPGPGSTGQFGSAHTVTVNNGGTLQLTNHWVMGDGVQNQVVVNEGGTLQFLNSDHYLGNIELTGGAITTSGGTHPWRTGNFGPGLITVNPSATTSTIAGTLCFVGTGAGPTTTFDVAGGGQVVMSSHIYDHGGFGGAMRLVKEGAGKLTLTSATSSWDGGLSINGGTVSVPTLTGGNTAGPLGGWSGTSAHFSFDGGTLEYTGGTVGGINRAFTINAGGATIDIANAAATVTWTDAAGAGPIIGTGMLTKAGPGTLVLASSNAYTGGTLVDDGTLRLGHVSSLGTGAATVNSGATLDLAGANVANDITLNGGTLYTANGASGTITLNNVAGNTINANGNYRILSGQITGPGGFTMGGINTPGIQLTNPANDFQGDVTINGGSYLRLTVSEVIPDTANVTINGYLRLEGANRTETIAGMNGGGHIFAIGSGNTLRVGANDASGSFSGYVGAWWDPNVRDIHLVKIGNGTQTLSNTLYHIGDTAVDGGILRLNRPSGFPSAASNGQFASPHTVTVNSGATLQIAADWVTGGGLTNKIVVDGGTLEFLNSDNYMGNIDLTGGAITTSGGTRPWRTGNWGSGLITVNASAVSSTIDGSLCFVGTAAGPNTTFDVADGAAADDLVVSALIYDHPGFERRMMLVKDGPGKMVLSATNTFAGGVTINDGTLSVTSLAAGNTPSALGAAYGHAPLLVFNGGTLEYTGPTVGGINRAFTINAGGATLDIANAATTVTWTDAAGAGPITGPGTLTKAGPGTLILTGSNNYSGGTTVSQGMLLFQNANALGTGTITLGDANSGSADVSLLAYGAHSMARPIVVSANGTGTKMIGRSPTGGGGYSQYTGAITLNDDLTINSGNNSDRMHVSGGISGTGDLTFTGGRRVTLAGANTFNGDIFITGTNTILQNMGGEYIPNTSSVDVGPGAILQIYGNETIDALTGSGTVRHIAGTYNLSVGAAGGSGLFTGVIQGNLSLTKIGSGTQILSGNNSYGGSTIVQGGVLKLGASNVIPDASELNNLWSGTGTFDLNGFDEGIRRLGGNVAITNTGPGTPTLSIGTNNGTNWNHGGPITGDLTIRKVGTGWQQLSENHDYTGGTIVDAGELRLSGPNDTVSSVGLGDVTINAGGTVRALSHNVFGHTAKANIPNIVINGGTLIPNQYLHVADVDMTGGTIEAGPAGGDGLQTHTSVFTTHAAAGTALIHARVHAFSGGITFDVAEGAADPDLLVTGQVHGSNGITKTGAGTQTFSGPNTYAGTTDVDAGTLLVNGTHTGGGIYTVAAGATLGGTGDIESDVDLSGAVSPGASVGTLYTNSQTWHDGGSFLFEINDVDAGPGTGWDLLDVTGNLDLTDLSVGGFTVDVVSLTGATPGPAADFDVLGTYEWEFVRTSGGVDEFDARDFLVDSSGFQNGLANISRFYVFEDADSLFLGYTVPEPSTFILAALGLLGLAFYGRRRKR